MSSTRHEEAVKYPRYRWVILAIAWLLALFPSWQWYLIPSLANSLISDLGLSHFQYTVIFIGPIVVGIFTIIPGGLLGDRYGFKSVTAISAFLTAAIGLARPLMPSFGGMAFLSLLFGVPQGMLMPNMTKLVAVWFPPKEVGFASGIYLTATAIGMSLGLLTGPLFSSWQQAFVWIGLLTLVMAVVWTLFVKDAPRSVQMHRPALKSSMQVAVRSRNIWLLGLGSALFRGAFTGFSGNLPKALQDVHYMTPVAAGAISSLLTWGLVAGNAVLPPISDRVGLRKPFIYAGAIIPAIGFLVAWRLAPAAATPILIFASGFILGIMRPLLNALPIEFPEIGRHNVGAASGVAGAVGNLGGFLLPLLVISPMVEAGTSGAYNIGILTMMLVLAAVIVPFLFMPETGPKKQASLPPSTPDKGQ